VLGELLVLEADGLTSWDFVVIYWTFRLQFVTVFFFFFNKFYLAKFHCFSNKEIGKILESFFRGCEFDSFFGLNLAKFFIFQKFRQRTWENFGNSFLGCKYK